MRIGIAATLQLRKLALYVRIMWSYGENWVLSVGGISGLLMPMSGSDRINGTKFIVGLWGVWRQRNNMALDPEPWTVQVAWHKLCHFHDELTQVFSPASFDPGVALNSRWWPAQPSFIEPNSDGSYQEADNCMDGGGLLRDSAGAWTIGYNSFSVGGGSVFLAEATAMRDELRIAWD